MSITQYLQRTDVEVRKDKLSVAFRKLGGEKESHGADVTPVQIPQPVAKEEAEVRSPEFRVPKESDQRTAEEAKKEREEADKKYMGLYNKYVSSIPALGLDRADGRARDHEKAGERDAEGS
ncbi:MAG: hypothetical protein P4M11_10985 [Candidatus Pacebacteria bacterium]|nr:hypothetical protein [Candidatus Paceibacterota bacterium]